MLFQFLPRLTDDEYSALESSIREHGIQVPILVDENKSIIDGHHRAEIAERLGIECPRRFAIDLTDEQKRTLALSLNVDRRHLSRDQRRELIASSVMADPHLSNRQHAERTGVDHKTVGSVRTELESRGEIPHVAERTDSAGRVQPASRTPESVAEQGSGADSGLIPRAGESGGERRALAVVPEPGAIAPRPVVGIDGKTYARPMPKPEPTLSQAERDRLDAIRRQADYIKAFVGGFPTANRVMGGHKDRDEILAALPDAYRTEFLQIESEHFA